MKWRRLLILGAGGHGKVAADCAQNQGLWNSIVFFDDRWPSLASVLDWQVAGRCASINEVAEESDEIFVAIGAGVTRLNLLNGFREQDFSLATIIHPKAAVSTLAQIGAGSIVVAGSVINASAVIGLGCIINTGASVDHDCRIGDGVHISPGARLAGDVNVGSGSWIGIGAVVRQGISIGDNVMVGAGAVVVKDVESGQTVVGVPAAPLRGFLNA